MTVLAVTGCDGGADDPGPPPPPVVVPDESDDCPAVFRQSILPDWHVTVSDADWAALQDEFLHVVERQAAGLETEPYHPAQVTYDDGTQVLEIQNAMIRLKGNSSWLQTIQLDDKPKMQFVISFNEVDPEGRFLGVRKVELDMPRTDRTFIRQRLALYALRTAGVKAQCANNARLFINGDYYGLYAHLERIDKEFLQRNFGDDDEGDLWKGGRIIRNNEDTFTWDRLEAFWHGAGSIDITGLDELVDIDESIKEWAAEAVIGDADGYYNGRPNYMLYDHPTRGFIWLPDDLDTVFDQDFLPIESSLLFPVCTGRDPNDRLHWAIVMADPTWQEKYVQQLAAARAKFDPEGMRKRLDNWSAQIEYAAQTDPRRPFSMDDHAVALDFMRDFVAKRPVYVDKWLACRTGGGADGDGDGVDFCNDCDDANKLVNPGAAEVCNGWDDDCNGLPDDVAGQTCQ